MKKNHLSFLGLCFFIVMLSNTATAQCPAYCFSVTATNPCKGIPILFTNTSTNNPPNFFLKWFFGDGSPVFTPVNTYTVAHTYTVASSFNPYMEVYDNATGLWVGTCSDVIPNLQVNGLSGINTPDSVCPGDVLELCVNSNYNGNFSTFWKFGDGATYNSNDWCATHTYTAQSTYTITAYASLGGCPLDSTKRAIISNNNAKPDANWWTYGSSPYCPNQQVGFTTNPTATYSWTFGDGGTSTLRQPTHSYTATGTYSVTLTKTNVCGKFKSSTQTVIISSTITFPNQPWFKLEAQSSPTCPNSSVGFNAPGGYSDYEWNFGDGSPLMTTGNGDANHTYGTTLTTYTVSVTITNACNNDTTLYKTVQVTANAPFPNDPSFEIRTNTLICPTTEAHFDVPDGFVNYQWNFGDGSPIINTADYWANHIYGTTLTTYTVSLVITNGCGNDSTLYKTIQVSNTVGFPNNNFGMNIASPSCINEAALFEAPGGYVNYQWNFGDGGSLITVDDRASHSYTATGTYTVTVLITNGCGNDTTISGIIVLDNIGSFPNWLNLEINPSGSTCPNDIVSLRTNTNSTYSSYLWVFGDGDTLLTTGAEVQHTYTATGTYNISLKITNGCGLTTTLYTSVVVTNTAPISPSLNLSIFQNPSCPGDDVYIIPNEGQSMYTYQWNFGDGGKDTTIGSGPIHAFATVGVYTVSVVAINGCGLTKTVTATHTVSATAVPSLVDAQGYPIFGYPGGEGGGSSSQYAGCIGDAIIFYFMGDAADNVWHFGDGDSGTATEHMVVYGGDGEAVPVTIIKHAYAANGTYTVSLTLTNGCGNSATGSLILNIGGNLQVDGEMTTSPPPFTTCAAIDFLGFGGANYDWDFGDGNTLSTSSPTVSHSFASQGVYVVSVVITNGCGNSATVSQSLNVNGAGGPAVTLNSSSGPTCVGGSNGGASVNVTSGQAPYTYLWDDANSQTTASVTGLSAGLYYVDVIDNIGCASNFAVSINNPAPIVLASSSVNSSCGISSGSASVSVSSGGNPPYAYLWSSGATTSSVSSLGWGQYPVTVTDVNSCTSSTNATVSDANAAVVTTNTITNINCNGGSSGAININVSAGNPPYTYYWSNNATTEDVTGLSAGAYSVTVTDNNMCMAVHNAVVTQAAAIVVTTSVPVPPTCGNFDGKASASVAGGTSPYTYLWPNAANQTTQTATGLPAGSYTVTVTDASGCISEGVASLSNSNAPNITEVVTNVSCFGGNNGAINLTVSGGTSPYLYTWNLNPPQTNLQDVSTLGAGSYFVSVNDAKGCQSFRLYTITQPALLTASVANTGATCNNNDGTAMASPSGGTAPYTYAWNSAPVQSVQTAIGLALGNYTATVTDSKGCMASSATTISATTLPIEICEVTVDSTSTHNIVVWDKPAVTNIDSFRVYRLVGATYVHIGSVSYNALSSYKDSTTGVNPNVTSYKYKIAAKDDCGGLSVLSAHHKTMHVTANVGVGGVVNLIWDNYEGFSSVYYRIWRDSTGTNPHLRDSVIYGNITYTDITPPAVLDTIIYYIEIVSPGGCQATIKNPNVMATNLNSSKSNVYRIWDTTVVSVSQLLNADNVVIFPNPSNGSFSVATGKISVLKIQIIDLLGREVAASYVKQKNRYDISIPQAKGVYVLKLVTNEGVINKKFIIE